MQGIHKLDRFPHVSMLLLLLKNGQWDVCTGQHCSAKESVFGSLPNFCCSEGRSGMNRISHPDWAKLCVELNCAPNQNTKFPSTTTLYGTGTLNMSCSTSIWISCQVWSLKYLWHSWLIWRLFSQFQPHTM